MNLGLSDSQGALSTRRARPAAPTRLDALDGLRTIAVMLVVAFHVGVPGMSGGFLGVDVFFVLSGFLITALLLRELTTTGRIDLARFWTRRFLRLVPAALLVIGTVIAWGLFVAEPYRRADLGRDALFSLLYVGNWHFIGTAGYFDDDGTTSPLLHLWSLAVEEQFYLAWPLVLTVVAWWAGSRMRRARGAAPDSASRHERLAHRRQAIVAGTVCAATVLAVASGFLLWWWYEPGAPDRAYMGTDSKIVEPLVGALAAGLLTRPRLRGWVTDHAQRLMTVGLLAVGVGVAVLPGPSPLYFTGGAVVFSLACAVLVTATSLADRRRGLSLVLGSTPMAYLGRISYGIYLWHWPLATWIIDGREFSPLRSTVTVAASIAAASVSYHLVESPLRTGRVVVPTPARVLPAGATCVGVVALAAVPLTAASSPWPVTATENTGTRADDRTIVVVGDSVMRRLVPALAPLAQERGQTVLSAARGGCPVIAAEARDGARSPLDDACAIEVPRAQEELIAQARPGTVVWWSRYELADRLGPDGALLRAGTPAFWQAQRADLKAAVDRLTDQGAHLVIVRVDRPGIGLVTRCSETSCDPFIRRLLHDDDLRTQWNALVDEVARHDERVSAISIDDVFCRDDASPCDDRLPLRDTPATAVVAPDSAPMLARPDGSHFSAEAMPGVAAALLERVDAVTGDADLAPR